MTNLEIILLAIIYVAYAWYIRPYWFRNEKIQVKYIFIILMYLIFIPIIIMYRTIYATIETNLTPLDDE